jgi:dUTP pyrophosphatase
MDATPATLRLVRLRAGARVPERATPDASGFDLYACIEGPGCMQVGPDPVRVPTGIAIEAPRGCDLQLRPRSGLSARGVMAAFGTLDADYRGELFITLYTIGTREAYSVHHGDRVAQLVVARLVDVQWEEAVSLAVSERGASGHGSTGR